jgi:Ser/Thr protein kinase RdoA (MazF antagonist)
MIAAYHAVLPLEPAEFSVLFDLITTRMAMTIVISSWRAARYPANRNYILRNNCRGLGAAAAHGDAVARPGRLSDSTRLPRGIEICPLRTKPFRHET